MAIYGINNTPKEMMVELAQKVKTIRKVNRITQKGFSERSGVAYATLRKFEHTGQISLESFLKLCDALGRIDEFNNILLPDDIQSKKNLFDV